MRARNLKPGFFSNELLASCNPLARLLFQGLWCLADRGGRLEDRVERIKALVLPYDDCNVNELLDELAAKGFILRYSVRGVAFICLPTFRDHQNPHPKEPESKLPPPKARVLAALHKRFAVEKNVEPGLLSESPIPHPSSSPTTADADDSLPGQFADLLASLEQHGLSPELARLYLGAEVDLPLVRAVLKFHAGAAAAKLLRNPKGALRSMLANPIGWGFARTDAGWDIPFDVTPPAPGPDPKVEAARCREQSLADQRRKEADQEAGKPLTLKQLRAKGGRA